MIKNANNILDIQNKQRIEKDQNKYMNDMKREQFITEPKIINTQEDYLENKYSSNSFSPNFNGKILNGVGLNTNLQVTKENLFLENGKSINDQPFNGMAINRTVHNVNNFSLIRENYPSQSKQFDPNYYKSSIPNYYTGQNQQNLSMRSNGKYNETPAGGVNKNKNTFANSADHYNRNMIHLLRKY